MRSILLQVISLRRWGRKSSLAANLSLSRPAPQDIAARKGTVMICCGCKRDLYRLNRDVYWNDIVDASQFDPIDAPPAVNGMTGDCPFCGHAALGCFINDILEYKFDPVYIAYQLLKKGEEVDIVSGSCYTESSSTEDGDL